MTIKLLAQRSFDGNVINHFFDGSREFFIANEIGRAIQELKLPYKITNSFRRLGFDLRCKFEVSGENLVQIKNMLGVDHEKHHCISISSPRIMVLAPDGVVKACAMVDTTISKNFSEFFIDYFCDKTTYIPAND
jgi:hypothetical protein